LFADARPAHLIADGSADADGSTGAGEAAAVLAALDPEQQAVAEALTGPVCVLAGAGTGKTRAITHRIAYGVRTGVMAPGSVLAVTFTARAAGEMRGRLRQLGAGGVQARTFHAAALRQLQYFWPTAVGGPPPRLIDRKFAMVADAASSCRLRADRTEVRDLLSEIEWAKVTQAVPDDYAAAAAKANRQPPRDPAEVARVYAAYERLKRERGVIDFEDVLLLTIGVLQDRPAIAETVRGQYRHFVVDEYQDVNPLQQRLLDIWLGERDSLCVVGDASQTIYSFTGATPDYLLAFHERFPDAKLIRLVRDYRSTPQVVALANQVLRKATGAAARARLELTAQRPSGPVPSFVEYPDEPAEADGVAATIGRLLAAGVRASEIAVLFRTNGQSQTYEQALAERDVPYSVKGAERFFDRPEVRQAVLLLRGQARAGGVAGAHLEDLPGQVRDVLSSGGWSPRPPAGGGAARERWESLAALVRLAEDYARTMAAAAGPDQSGSEDGLAGLAGLAGFVAELDERAALQHAPTLEGVTLASLHAAKGLEWDAVFLVGLTEGMLPITYAETPEQVEEERRLLYVGITRAREHLALSWSLARTPGGRAGRRPSRFLDGLRPSGSARSDRTGRRAGDGAVPSRKGRSTARCRVCGRALVDVVARKLGRCEDCPADLDEALFERLRGWRSAQAQEQGVPAYCVFTDATMTAIAETRPASVAALSAIPGVGPAKLDRYAADVLALCAGGTDADAGERGLE
jgi:DNA helicase-2/ATP-dependent DNA helicase PcrA